MTSKTVLPDPPYYAVIFTSTRTEVDQGYDQMAQKMEDLAREQPGFLGLEAARGADAFGVTISYWTDEASIAAWKSEADHQIAQKYGRDRWYSDYVTRVARVDRQYAWP